MTCRHSIPRHLQIVHLALAEDGEPMQWAVVTSADSVFITFRGTMSPIDVLIDVGFMKLYVESVGLQVHCGIWSSLHGVANQFAALMRLLQNALQTKHDSSHVVLCGHSLGGGYAILTALEMLHFGHTVTSSLPSALHR